MDLNALMDQIKEKFNVQHVEVNYIGGAWQITVYAWHEHHNNGASHGTFSRQREKLEDALASILNPEKPAFVVEGNKCTNACQHFNDTSLL